LLIEVVVHSASIQDRDGAKVLLQRAYDHGHMSRLLKVWADQIYRGDLAAWMWRELTLMLEVVERAKDEEGNVLMGFQVLPRRWVVERTFAWLGRYRRLSKDYEFWPASSEAMIQLATSRTMMRRLTRLKAQPSI
jgi:putative transposase